MTVTQYQNLFFDTLDFIKTLILTGDDEDEIIPAVSPESRVETRYITSQGVDSEQWLGFLRGDAKEVDCWLITLMELRGIDAGDKSIGSFDKSVTIAVDYYADYRYGVNVVKVDGVEVQTNTEREFDKKVLAFDFALEKKQTCFGSSKKQILTWGMRKSIAVFKNGSCHRAHFVINLRFTNLH